MSPFYSGRLKYLVHKGAILQRGQKVKVEFGKRSTSPQGDLDLYPRYLTSSYVPLLDKMFVVQVLCSEANQLLRYTDDGTKELCRWSIDLSPLPSFQWQVRNWRGSPFITSACYVALYIFHDIYCTVYCRV